MAAPYRRKLLLRRSVKVKHEGRPRMSRPDVQRTDRDRVGYRPAAVSAAIRSGTADL